MIHREDKYVTPSGNTEIKAGDHLLILADSKESRKQIQNSFDIDHD
jgi:Trk K+ transport system NAD-binding subunit